MKWYQKAADQGDIDARYNLGLCYYKGQGVEQDYTEAVKWIRKAADSGDENIKAAAKAALRELGIFL